MAVGISQKLNSDYVRINLGDDNVSRYYVVKKDKADAFTASYKKQATKTSIITNSAFLTSIMAGTFATMYATKKISSAFLRWTLNCAGGVVAGMASLPITGIYAKNREDKIVKRYGAKAE